MAERPHRVGEPSAGRRTLLVAAGAAAPFEPGPSAGACGSSRADAVGVAAAVGSVTSSGLAGSPSERASVPPDDAMGAKVVPPGAAHLSSPHGEEARSANTLFD